MSNDIVEANYCNSNRDGTTSVGNNIGFGLSLFKLLKGGEK